MFSLSLAKFVPALRARLAAIGDAVPLSLVAIVILPLFVAALIADWVSARVCRPKLYHALSQQFASA